MNFQSLLALGYLELGPLTHWDRGSVQVEQHLELEVREYYLV